MTDQPPNNRQDNNQDPDLILKFDRHKLVINHRYEVLHILNDLAIATWFLIGSIFFLFNNLTETGTWLFIIGSGQMMFRPIIRIAHKIHIKDIPAKNIHF